MTDALHRRLEADARRADAAVALALHKPLEKVGAAVRKVVQSAVAQRDSGEAIDLDDVMARVGKSLGGLGPVAAALGKAAAARANAGGARAAALIREGAGEAPTPERFTPSGELAKAAQVSADRVVAQLREDMEARARAALEHPTPTLASRLRFNEAIAIRGSRGLQRSAEMAGAQQVAEKAGVQYWIHTGPVDDENHPTSRIYLGAVMTREQWLLVDPLAFTDGLHVNERGTLEPIDPSWSTVKDPAALQEAIDGGGQYLETDVMPADARAELGAALRAREASRRIDRGGAIAARAGEREAARRAAARDELVARRDAARAGFERAIAASRRAPSGGWDITVAPEDERYVVDPDALVQYAGVPPGSKVQISRVWLVDEQRYAISVRAQGPGIRDMRRSIDFLGRAVQQDGLYLTATGQGQGAKLLAAQVDALVKAGRFDELRTVATSDGGDNGYYSWPRLGYDGPLEESHILALREGAPGELDAAIARARDAGRADVRVSDLMADAAGRAAWKAHGSDIAVTFELRDGSYSRRTLDAYLAGKAKPATAEAEASVARAVADREASRARLAAAAAEVDAARAEKDRLFGEVWALMDARGLKRSAPADDVVRASPAWEALGPALVRFDSAAHARSRAEEADATADAAVRRARDALRAAAPPGPRSAPAPDRSAARTSRRQVATSPYVGATYGRFVEGRVTRVLGGRSDRATEDGEASAAQALQDVGYRGTSLERKHPAGFSVRYEIHVGTLDSLIEGYGGSGAGISMDALEALSKDATAVLDISWWMGGRADLSEEQRRAATRMAGEIWKDTLAGLPDGVVLVNQPDGGAGSKRARIYELAGFGKVDRTGNQLGVVRGGRIVPVQLSRPASEAGGRRRDADARQGQ